MRAARQINLPIKITYYNNEVWFGERGKYGYMSNVYEQFLWFKAFMVYLLLCLYGCFKNAQEIIAMKESLYIGKKTHIDFHKTFASIFLAYTTSILKVISFKILAIRALSETNHSAVPGVLYLIKQSCLSFKYHIIFLNKTPARAFTPPAESKMGTRPGRAVTREIIERGVYSLISVLPN